MWKALDRATFYAMRKWIMFKVYKYGCPNVQKINGNKKFDAFLIVLSYNSHLYLISICDTHRIVKLLHALETAL